MLKTYLHKYTKNILAQVCYKHTYTSMLKTYLHKYAKNILTQVF